VLEIIKAFSAAVSPLVPVLAGLTALVTAMWAIVVYARQWKENARTRLVEARKPFLELQLALYVETSKVVGKLVSLDPGSDEWKAQKLRFHALYWSELSMVEDEEVEGAMKDFKEALTEYERDPTKASAQSGIEDQSYFLAHHIRDSIHKNWSGVSTPLPEIVRTEKVFKSQ
jgi:hypothetical protein